MRTANSDEGEDWILTTEKFPMNPDPNGAGDLTAALFLGRYMDSDDARQALEQMANAVFAVFEHTFQAKSRELHLVDARFEIMNPPVRFVARRA